ncbi:PREDICTED: protein RALF-like 28 [Camelina sativa]|uniref:Protein RALF-like 28 n=1 Tax=Camelina sativa TaxID=90675 RepID=A0ABM1QTY0_CAMSA|nr:PREDICTED: protein RALF-like 28 [Camelina sativa]
MGISKGTQRFMLVAIFIAFVVISNINVAVAKYISYPAIGRDRQRGCSHGPHGKCPPAQHMSPYHRGCDLIHRCRRQPSPPPVPKKM